MADDKLAQKRNTGPEPMEARPNHDREKAFTPDNPPQAIVDEKQKLPEKTAKSRVEQGMKEAVGAVKERM